MGFVPDESVGQWACRVHPASDGGSCCGYSSTIMRHIGTGRSNARGGAMALLVYHEPHALGCVRCDHSPSNEADMPDVPLVLLAEPTRKPVPAAAVVRRLVFRLGNVPDVVDVPWQTVVADGRTTGETRNVAEALRVLIGAEYRSAAFQQRWAVAAHTSVAAEAKVARAVLGDAVDGMTDTEVLGVSWRDQPVPALQPEVTALAIVRRAWTQDPATLDLAQRMREVYHHL